MYCCCFSVSLLLSVIDVPHERRYRALSNGASVQLRHMLGRAARCAQRQRMVREEGMALVDLCGAMLGDGAAKADVQTHLQVGVSTFLLVHG